MADKKVSVLIPAHNEEKSINDTICAVRSISEVDEIVVVDDASVDNTAKIASCAGAVVVTLPSNLGKGGALNKGMEIVKGDIVALVDADLGKSAVNIKKLIEPILANRADMTIAKFPKARKKGGFGLVKGLARNGIRFFTRIEVMAPLSGQRVMIKEVIAALGGFESGYGVEVGMTIDAVRKGFRILEIEVEMTHRETGRDLYGFLHRGKQFYHVARVLAKRLAVR